jgi:hypothetical protein
MPYKPTGRPPGRPKKIPRSTPLPQQPAKPEPVIPEIITPASVQLDEEAAVTEPRSVPLVVAPGIGGLCGDCYPEGWPDGATGLGCQHGSWTRLATGFAR